MSTDGLREAVEALTRLADQAHATTDGAEGHVRIRDDVDSITAALSAHPVPSVPEEERECTCEVYVVDYSDPDRYHPENLDREEDPSCPVHAQPSVPAPAPTDWHDPEARAAAGMGPDHDRKVIEGVQEHGRQAVVVRCPHVVGLCYDDTDNGMLANLPCPCNDRSEVVGRLVLVGADEAVTPQPDSSGLAPAPEEEGSRRSTALRPRCSASTTTRSRCPRGSAPSRRSRRPNVAEQPTDWIKDAGWFDGLMHEAQQGNRAEFDAMLRRLLSEHARAIAAPVPVPEDEQRGCICGHEDSAHDADGCRTCQGRSEDEQRETLAEVEAFERQQLQVREVAELGEVIRGLNDHIAELLGIDPTDPMAIAAHVLGSTWLCNDRARVWDEAAEATADWMANNPSPSGIPVDPPRNPYKAGDPRGE